MRRIRRLTAAAAITGLLAACEPVDPTVKETPVSVLRETVGVGRPAMKGDLVTINYRMTTEDGREILQEDGYRFILGTGSVIAGIDDAVKGMRITGERVITCPPSRHWGREGYGDEDVPADATLLIAIELEAID